jgi:hypothetical protein
MEVLKMFALNVTYGRKHCCLLQSFMRHIMRGRLVEDVKESRVKQLFSDKSMIMNYRIV